MHDFTGIWDLEKCAPAWVGEKPPFFLFHYGILVNGWVDVIVVRHFEVASFFRAWITFLIDSKCNCLDIILPFASLQNVMTFSSIFALKGLVILKPSSSMSKGSDFTKVASKDIRSRPFDHIIVNVAFVAKLWKGDWKCYLYLSWI